MTAPARREVLLAGCGAIGSRFAAAVDDRGLALTCADRDRVAGENIGVAAYAAVDLQQAKAAVLAGRRRARGAPGRALHGDVRYTVRPGLVRALDAAVLCLDNPSAIHDAAEVLWPARSVQPPLPVLALACGGATGGYQARLFVAPGLCPCCLFGEAERRSDRLAQSASCADTTAPRASAAAAAAAAAVGAAVLRRWLAGERGLENCRLQSDDGREYLIRMPAALSPRCPVAHPEHAAPPRAGEELGGSIGALTAGALAEAAMRCAGDDAELVLGRRAVPMAGLRCPQCRAFAAAPPLLLPGALAAWRSCACSAPPRPLGERNSVTARELLAPDLAPLSLAAWGAGHGDEFLAVGRKGRVLLRCDFSWSDLDDA